MTAEAPAAASRAILPVTLKRIVLTGFMGAGKTSVGRMLASDLGWQFLDLDAHLEQRTESSIAELFTLHGEVRFRRLESAALANALHRTETIVALGGGTPEFLTNRLLLEQTPGTLTVFLQAPFPVLFDRCMLQSIASPDHIRPLLTSAEEAQRRFSAREPVYRRVAGLILDTAELSTREAAAALAVQLAALTNTPASFGPRASYEEQRTKM